MLHCGNLAQSVTESVTMDVMPVPAPKDARAVDSDILAELTPPELPLSPPPINTN